MGKSSYFLRTLGTIFILCDAQLRDEERTVALYEYEQALTWVLIGLLHYEEPDAREPAFVWGIVISSSFSSCIPFLYTGTLRGILIYKCLIVAISEKDIGIHLL